MGKGAKVQETKMEQRFKDMPTVTHSPSQTTGQITGAEFQTKQIQKIRT